MSTLRFAILGAGAMGSIIGAHLARAGHPVTMLARGARAAQIRAQGLRLDGLAQMTVAADVVDDPRALRDVDVFVVTTKARHTAASLAPYERANVGVAFSVQNGIAKDDFLAAAFGRPRVLGSLANVSGELKSGGEVLFTRNVALPVGELDGTLSERATRIASAMHAAGLPTVAVTDIADQEWSKFAGWVPMMMLSVLTRSVTWKFMTDDAIARLYVQLAREVAAVAAACGARLTDAGMAGIATIAGATTDEAVAFVKRMGEEMRRAAPLHKVSALQDVEAGRALELDETLVYALRLATERRVELPTIRSLLPVVGGIDRLRENARM